MANQRSPRNGNHPETTRGREAFILVVDDDPDILAALCAALADAGYGVHGARDGIEALDAIEERRPDLIITDLLMPTMTGFELLGALHEDPDLASIPTLIITAARGPENAFRDLGGAVFPKPLDLDRLLRVIGAHTRREDPTLAN